MLYSNVKYKLEAYTVEGITRGLTENDIKVFYRDLNWNAHSNYRDRLLGGEFIIPKKVTSLFAEYQNGYPDFLLIHAAKKNKFKFVEVKLDNDKLSPNQIHFNNKLAEVADVTIAYFNSTIRYEDPDNVVGVRELEKGEKELLLRCQNLRSLQKKKGFKELWVIGALYKDFGATILKGKVLGQVANITNLKKDKIVWFIRMVLMKKK